MVAEAQQMLELDIMLLVGVAEELNLQEGFEDCYIDHLMLP